MNDYSLGPWEQDDGNENNEQNDNNLFMLSFNNQRSKSLGQWKNNKYQSDGKQYTSKDQKQTLTMRDQIKPLKFKKDSQNSNICIQNDQLQEIVVANPQQCSNSIQKFLTFTMKEPFKQLIEYQKQDDNKRKQFNQNNNIQDDIRIAQNHFQLNIDQFRLTNTEFQSQRLKEIKSFLNDEAFIDKQIKIQEKKLENQQKIFKYVLDQKKDNSQNILKENEIFNYNQQRFLTNQMKIQIQIHKKRQESNTQQSLAQSRNRKQDFMQEIRRHISLQKKKVDIEQKKNVQIKFSNFKNNFQNQQEQEFNNYSKQNFIHKQQSRDHIRSKSLKIFDFDKNQNQSLSQEPKVVLNLLKDSSKIKLPQKYQFKFTKNNTYSNNINYQTTNIFNRRHL